MRKRHIYRIHIEQPIQKQNPSGSLTTEWIKIKKDGFACTVLPTSGKELMLTGRELESQTATFIINYTKHHIDNTMRINYRGSFYDIKSVVPDNITGFQHITIIGIKGINNG